MEDGQTIQMAFFSGGIGAWEWVIILVIMLLLFGRRLPDVMRNLGSSAREFRKGLEDGKEAVDMNKPVEGTQANQAVADKPDTAPKQES